MGDPGARNTLSVKASPHTARRMRKIRRIYMRFVLVTGVTPNIGWERTNESVQRSITYSFWTR